MRRVVYTVIVGGYDRLADVRQWPGWDFICFSDTIKPRGPWQVRPIGFERDATAGRAGNPLFWISRYASILTHEVLPEYDYSIYSAGNQTVTDDPTALCNHLGWPAFSAPRHYARDCIYAELTACVVCSKTSDASARADMERYRAAGVPEHSGLYDCGIILRKHNDPTVIAACGAWWDALTSAAVLRDQPALAFAAWKHNLSILGFDPALRRKYFMERTHVA